MERTLKVLPVYDDLFKKSFWNFDIEQELNIALENFEAQFDIKFEVETLKKWNSIGSRDLSLYPEKIIRTLEKKEKKDLIDYLLKRIKSTNLPLSSEEYSSMKERLLQAHEESSSIMHFLGFFSAVTEVFIEESLHTNLKKEFPLNEAGFVIGFTGKKFEFSPTDSFRSLGIARSDSIFTKDAYVLIGTWSREISPNAVILHEIGHIFGAKHTKSSSVMYDETSKKFHPSKFDKKNKKIIQNKLMGYI